MTNKGAAFPGILPYDLWPVRNLVPVPVKVEGRSQTVWIVDVRRIDRETLERLAFAIAPKVGITAEEWLEYEGVSRRPFIVLNTPGQILLEAPSLEKAVALLDEYRTSGTLAHGRMFLQSVVNVGIEMLAEKGGVRRG